MASTPYTDRKRYLWCAAFIGPCVPCLTIALYLSLLPHPLLLLLPLFYVFVVIPTLDGWCGEDPDNPPDELAQDRYYQGLLYADLVLLYLDFFGVAWFVGTHDLPGWALVGLALGTGITSVDVLLIGHELGHKHTRLDIALARVALALVGYGHFRIEHNHGHHVHVATPEDCASARMGESVYRFALRELPGGLRRGWALEGERLRRAGHSRWSVHNEILQCAALTLAIAAGLVWLLGLVMVPFLVIHHLYAWYGLTQANYVQHYGLLRQKLPNGRYEPTAPRHSWNTNHVFSNLVTFHLQRHSDHHANAVRPYQALRNFSDLPRLPSGYPGCFGLAAIPQLWFKVMNPRLLEWAGGDLTKVNTGLRCDTGK
jgi:alkane 1-monooxygenase